MLACIVIIVVCFFCYCIYFSMHAKGKYIICKLIIVSACTVYLRDVVPIYLNKKAMIF